MSALGVGCAGQEPPPVSAEMHSVIQAAGLNMREELILNISPDRPAHAPTVIVLAGLTRRCESVHVVREALADCVAGRAAMVGVLQHYDTGQFPASGSWMGGGERYEKLPDSFSECASRFSAAARGTACRLVIGRQWFKQTRKHECTRQVPPVGNVDRATIQTLALGRAYEWARAFAPGARLFVRARLDMAFCAPDLRNSPALPRRMLVADSESDSITGGRFVYDLGAIMSADAADDYFGCALTAWPALGRIAIGFEWAMPRVRSASCLWSHACFRRSARLVGWLRRASPQHNTAQTDSEPDVAAPSPDFPRSASARLPRCRAACVVPTRYP